MARRFTEDDLIKGLLESDRNVLQHMYGEFFPMIRDYVLKNSGSDDDAADVFQEGMVVVFDKAHDPEFKWKSTIKTFLYAVCRNKWLMTLRSRKGKETEAIEGVLDIKDGDDPQIALEIFEKRELMRTCFKLLGEECQRVLHLFFAGNSMKVIAELQGITPAYAKKKKFLCQKRLIERVMSDPSFQELHRK